MPKEGKKAPDFKLKDKKGQVYSLKTAKTKYTVVYFYPKDDTPGCTIQAKTFSKNLKNFDKIDAAVYGISGGDERTKDKFCLKHKLTVTLLSDPDFKVAKSYKSFGEKTFMGRKYDGIFRNTFVIDAKGKILKVYEKATPETNPGEVLEFLNMMEKAGSKKSNYKKTVKPSVTKAKKPGPRKTTKIK